MAVVISTGSRLHCGLLDLGRATPRAYGGSGFLIDGPEVRVRIQENDQWVLETKVSLDQKAKIDIQSLIDKFINLGIKKSALVFVEAFPIQHIGLGTKTGLMLSIAVGINKELNLGLTKDHIQLLTGRGGASGIGIHGFFLGGFLIDCGHPNCCISSLQPSGVSHPTAIPRLSQRLPIPEFWEFHLILGKGIRRTGYRESIFFKKNTQIPRQEIISGITVTHKILRTSVNIANIQLLKRALSSLHKLGFKKRELLGQTQEIRSLIKDFEGCSEIATGMSSMGPLIFVVSEMNNLTAKNFVLESAKEKNALYLGSFTGNNFGFKESYE
jgi:beta-ribofuranosylaminobenzene 5'-phosphate synthase